MARKATADTSSYWLPGFEPDLPSLPEPEVVVGPVGQIDTPAPAAAPVAAAAAVETTIAEAPAETVDAAPAQSWRLSVVASDPTPLIRFPRLRRVDLAGLGGTAAKFDANVRAIEILTSLDAEQRQANAA